MARVTAPFGSSNTSGSIADIHTYQRRSGANVVKLWAKPRNPQTITQQANRLNHLAVLNSYTYPGMTPADWAGWILANKTSYPRDVTPQVMHYRIHRAPYSHGLIFDILGAFYSDYLYHTYFRFINKWLKHGSIDHVTYAYGWAANTLVFKGACGYYAPYDVWYTPLFGGGTAGQVLYCQMFGYSLTNFLVAQTGIDTLTLI